MKVIGVLSIQGACKEHINHLNQVIVQDGLELRAMEVSNTTELSQCDALVIPGGESSAMSLTAERTGMFQPLVEFANSGKPVWGTCAGLILLAGTVHNAIEGQRTLKAMDITVERNAFGRQLDSFVKPLDFSEFISGCTSFPAIFIRAPVITDTDAARVQILSKLDKQHNDLIVAIRQGNLLGTSFHPELSDDNSFHRWFITDFVLV